MEDILKATAGLMLGFGNQIYFTNLVNEKKKDKRYPYMEQNRARMVVVR